MRGRASAPSRRPSSGWRQRWQPRGSGSSRSPSRRAENFFPHRPDLPDTVRRLQAYEAAGADVLYAPALPDAEAIRTVCAAVARPVNVLMGGALQLSVEELGALGVQRISVGSALSRTALGAVLTAGHAILDFGTFTFGTAALPYPEANGAMAEGAATPPA